MRMRLVTLCGLIPLAGCSLMGLSDDLGREACTTEPDSCASLNDPDAPGYDFCRPWRCNEQTGFCEVMDRDDDRDDHPPAECAEELQVAEGDVDCADDDQARFPGNAEACDTRDNDCDGRIDEGALQTRTAKLVAPLSDRVTRASYARHDDDAQRLALAYVQLGGQQNQRRAFASLVSSRLSPDAPAQPQALIVQERVDIQPAGMALAPLGDGEHALAAIDENAPQRILAGVLTAQGLRVSDAAWDGLPCGTGESCPPQPETTTPTVAALGQNVLVGYVRDDPDRRQCLDASAAPVWLNLLRHQDSALEPSVEPAMSAGTSTDRAAPALVPIGEDAGWLLGTVDGGAVIRLQRVWIDQGTLSLETLAEVATHSRPHDLAVGLASEEDGRRHGALLYVAGCANDSELLLHEITLRMDATTLTVEDAVTLDASTGIKTYPAVAYSPRHATWMAVWRNDARGPVLGRSWAADGTLRGEQPVHLLQALEDDSLEGGARPFVFAYDAPTDDLWFGATSYAIPRGASDAGAFYGTRIGCFDE